MVRSLRRGCTNAGPRRYATRSPKRTQRLTKSRAADRDGQTDGERTATPLPGALRSRYASMKFREVSNNCQSKAETSVSVHLRLGPLTKRIEHVRQEARVNSRP